MAFAIKVLNGLYLPKSKRHIDGWISAYGYTTAVNADSARRFGKKESAEEFALILVTKCPHYMGKLEVATIVVGHKRGDTTWREKKEKSHGPLLRRGPGKSRHRDTVRH